MLLSRSRFFLLLFLVLVGPFFGPKLFWFICSRRTMGKVYFMGGQLDAISGTKKYLYIRYPLGKDTIEFVSNMFFRWPDDTPVMVRYSRIDPVDARIDLPVCVWGDTMVHILLPIGIWLVLLLTPNRFDPLIPWGCRVLLRWGWPPIMIVEAPEAGRAEAERPPGSEERKSDTRPSQRDGSRTSAEIGRAPKAEGRQRSDGGAPTVRRVGPTGGSDGEDLEK